MPAEGEGGAHWDGRRWVDLTGTYWWDGQRWSTLVVPLGEHWITADRTQWFDGSAWAPIGRRPSKAAVWTLCIITSIALVATFAIVIAGTSYSWCSPSAPGLEGTGCSFDWLAFVVVGGGTDAALLVFAISYWRRRRDPGGLPPALFERLSADR